MKEFIQNLKIGDKVGWQSNQGRGISTINNITKTMIKTTSGRYNKTSGNVVGGGTWCTEHLVELTPKWEQDFKKRQIRNKIYSWIQKGILNELSFQKLTAIYMILKPYGK